MSKQTVPWTSSKKDIYEAYKEILKKYEDLVNNPPAPQKAAREAERREELVQKVSAWTPESLLDGISRMKISIGRTLDDLSQKLATEAGRLEETRQACKIAEEDLERTKDAKVTADAIEQWLADHETEKKRVVDELDKKKKDLNADIAATKLAWEAEQEEHKKKLKAERDEVDSQRKRELEEYTYDLGKRMKADEDAAEELRKQLERELSRKRQDTEDQLATMKQELEQKKDRLANLETQAETWPKTLEAAREEAKAATERELKSTYEHRIALLEQKAASAQDIATNRIQGLEDYLSKQETRIQELNAKLEQQTARVHEIANKAVEGASGATAFRAVNTIAMEQAKRPPIDRDVPRS